MDQSPRSMGFAVVREVMESFEGGGCSQQEQGQEPWPIHSQISPGIEPVSPASPALLEDSLPAEPLGKQMCT